ncbi:MULTISPECIES: RNA polymerase sigma-70 factor [unclassified Leeuwenhoekiella]|uniref:RNA polymerase sigma-70 factor n=1 Tax=unclassified Leeuwenhoekiella TaxID=2615029 RepID=UPI0025C1F88C|nr:MULTISPECIES: RNA polymerase sigma-70 factor [unclassified Leeuwenhoekiella]
MTEVGLDTAEFKVMYKSLYPSLCLFAKNYLTDLQVSKDAVQEVFIRVWENNVYFENEIAAKSYLYTAVKNKCLDVLKSKYVRVIDHQLDPVKMEWLESDRFFYTEVVRSETSSLIDKAMKSLPYRCAQIIKLSLNNYSNQEIADRLSVSINTVKAQKKIAYKKMRPLLKEHYHLLTILLISSN